MRLWTGETSSLNSERRLQRVQYTYTEFSHPPTFNIFSYSKDEFLRGFLLSVPSSLYVVCTTLTEDSDKFTFSTNAFELFGATETLPRTRENWTLNLVSRAPLPQIMKVEKWLILLIRIIQKSDCRGILDNLVSKGPCNRFVNHTGERIF